MNKQMDKLKHSHFLSYWSQLKLNADTDTNFVHFTDTDTDFDTFCESLVSDGAQSHLMIKLSIRVAISGQALSPWLKNCLIITLKKC